MHTILFTGHLIDAPGRKHPRFPPEKEAALRQELRTRLSKVKTAVQDELQGIAGGACGGDILFHEECTSLHIPSGMYLALPIPEFKNVSVSYAGKEWDDRFDSLVNRLPVQVLSEAAKKDKNVWEAVNEWMLQEALKNGGRHLSFMAVWNGKGGDGPGGTAHMVDVAKRNDAAVSIINLNDL